MSQPVAVLILLALVGYFASLVLHPYTKCGTCNGKGSHYGKVFFYARRDCHACSGKGQKQRLGAALLRIGNPRQSQSRVERPFGKGRK